MYFKKQKPWDSRDSLYFFYSLVDTSDREEKILINAFAVQKHSRVIEQSLRASSYRQLPFYSQKSELIQRAMVFSHSSRTLQQRWKFVRFLSFSLIPFYSFFFPLHFSVRRRKGEEVVSQDNELRRDGRLTRAEDIIFRLLHKGMLHSVRR